MHSVKVTNLVFKNFISNATGKQIVKPLLRRNNKSKQIGPFGWFLLVLEYIYNSFRIVIF